MSRPEQETLTDENINKAITWYEANRDEIAAALPISTPGVLYKQGCLEPLSRAVESWKNGKTPLNLAVCYIHTPINCVLHLFEGKEVKPYFQNDRVTLYHGDCREILPAVSDFPGCFDHRPGVAECHL